MMLQERKPMTEQEVYDCLTEEVERQRKNWGVNSFYAKSSENWREKTMKEFKAGKVVQVYSVDYCDKYGNGTGEYTDVLYSDGHVETMCYGYLD